MGDNCQSLNCEEFKSKKANYIFKQQDGLQQDHFRFCPCRTYFHLLYGVICCRWRSADLRSESICRCILRSHNSRSYLNPKSDHSRSHHTKSRSIGHHTKSRSIGHHTKVDPSATTQKVDPSATTTQQENGAGCPKITYGMLFSFISAILLLSA